MSVKLTLTTPSQTITMTERSLAAFVLEKEMYTPYSTLSGTAYGTFSLQQLSDTDRIGLTVEDTVLHLGTVEQLRLEQTEGVTRIQFQSKGLTAMLLHNQLTPGLHPGMSLDGILTEYFSFPEEITWESSTDTSNYLYVKENTSLWDGITNLTYKLTQRYPFIAGHNEVRMTLPTTYRQFYGKESLLLAAGMQTNQSRIYSDYYMADVDGNYAAFHETEPEATARGIVRTKELALDRQYLYDPQEALRFRRKFADRGLVSYYTDWNGAQAVSLGDRLSYDTVLEEAVITYIRMTGNAKGIRTRMGCYFDAFYNSERG